MQAALTAMDKKCKNALARSERLCEASIDSVRRGAAASIAAEAARLEGLLTGCTTRPLTWHSWTPRASSRTRPPCMMRCIWQPNHHISCRRTEHLGILQELAGPL